MGATSSAPGSAEWEKERTTRRPSPEQALDRRRRPRYNRPPFTPYTGTSVPTLRQTSDSPLIECHGPRCHDEDGTSCKTYRQREGERCQCLGRGSGAGLTRLRLLRVRCLRSSAAQAMMLGWQDHWHRKTRDSAKALKRRISVTLGIGYVLTVGWMLRRGERRWHKGCKNRWRVCRTSNCHERKHAKIPKLRGTCLAP